MPPTPPPAASTTCVTHRVAFFETDAMGVVHHSNYLRFFEIARTRWLEEHDVPYAAYLELGLQLPVIHCEVDYHESARFDDSLQITSWLEWVRGASMRIAYRVECEERLLASGATEHASVNADGRVRRLPRARREHLSSLAGASELGAHPGTPDRVIE